MLNSLKLFVAAALGVALGLELTDMAVKRGVAFAVRKVGPWVAEEDAGTDKADPYAQAKMARTAEIPLGLGEGVSLVAASDSAGAPLDGRCDYVVGAQAPPARYWTLSVMTPQGRLIANESGRYGFTSAEIVRDQDGSFDIEAAPRARAGNWLPIGDGLSRFVFVLRLYDTPITATLRTLSAAEVPSIVKKGCA